MLAPTDDQLRDVDQSAPNDQFITQGGRVAGPGETPVLDLKVPGTGKNILVHPKQEIRVKHEDDTERPLREHVDAAKATYGDVKEEATSSAAAAQEEGKAHARDVASSDQPGDVAEEKKTGVMDKLRQFRVRIFLHLTFVPIFILLGIEWTGRPCASRA